MFCTNCGAQLPDGTRFCTSCGARLEAADATVPLADAPAPAADGETRVAGGAEPEAPKRSGKGLVIAAVVTCVLAVAAVAALVVVVIDPFGLHLLGDASVVQEVEGDEPEIKPDDSDTDPVPQSLAVATAPSKTDYLVGESLDPAGLSLTVTLDDGTTQTVTYASDAAADFSFDPSSFDAAGSVEVTVTYEDLSATFAVTVTEPEPEPEPEPAPAPTSAPTSSGTYVLPDSSTRLYSADELSGLSNWQLYVARNEIYARHGRMFQRQDLQDYFNAQSWYTPLYSPEQFDSMGLLSSTEQQNAATILSVEKARGSEYV
ncbi:YARHG domain-containing protein [Thermophilibacter sp.]